MGWGGWRGTYRFFCLGIDGGGEEGDDEKA
jgi:hypothetical protein